MSSLHGHTALPLVLGRHTLEPPDPYTSTAAEKMLTILCLIYCFWVVALAGRAWWWGAKASDKLRTSRRVQFFVAASLVTMLLVLPAIILEYLQPRVRGALLRAGLRRVWLRLASRFFRVVSSLDLSPQPHARAAACVGGGSGIRVISFGDMGTPPSCHIYLCTHVMNSSS